MIRFCLLLLLAAHFSCKTGQKAATARAPFIELKSGACFGFCPVFRLTVRNNGLVEYEGIRFAEKIGLDSFRLTKAELSGLRKKVQEVNLWQYPDRIETQVADAPFVTLTTFRDTQPKSVTGSIDRPAPLLELENLLKDLSEKHGFQVTRGVNPNEVPAERRREVIVKLQPEINAGNWVRQFTGYRFILVRRISSENTWLVAYDAEELEEKAVLDLFKKSDGVIDAQANRKVEERE